LVAYSTSIFTLIALLVARGVDEPLCFLAPYKKEKEKEEESVFFMDC
jgi:hypothetical protein